MIIWELGVEGDPGLRTMDPSTNIHTLQLTRATAALLDFVQFAGCDDSVEYSTVYGVHYTTYNRVSPTRTSVQFPRGISRLRLPPLVRFGWGTRTMLVTSKVVVLMRRVGPRYILLPA